MIAFWVRERTLLWWEASHDQRLLCKALPWKVIHVRDISERSHTTERQSTLSCVRHKEREKPSVQTATKSLQGCWSYRDIKHLKTIVWNWRGFFVALFELELFQVICKRKKEKVMQHIIKLVFGRIKRNISITCVFRKTSWAAVCCHIQQHPKSTAAL